MTGMREIALGHRRRSTRSSRISEDMFSFFQKMGSHVPRASRIWVFGKRGLGQKPQILWIYELTSWMFLSGYRHHVLVLLLLLSSLAFFYVFPSQQDEMKSCVYVKVDGPTDTMINFRPFFYCFREPYPPFPSFLLVFLPPSLWTQN